MDSRIGNQCGQAAMPRVARHGWEGCPVIYDYHTAELKGRRGISRSRWTQRDKDADNLVTEWMLRVTERKELG